MPRDDLLHQVQTKPSSRRSRPEPMKGLEHALSLILRYAGTVIHYLKRSAENSNSHRVPAMFDRVLHQICHYPLKRRAGALNGVNLVNTH
jgi:hypothetical protein